jgi:hypothetical protein
LIGGVFGKISQGVSNLIGGFVENVQDVASDIRPGTVASVVAPEASAAVLAATTIQNVLQRSSEGRAAERSLTQPRSTSMPHVDGHMDGELPVGGVGLENANTALIGFGTQAITQLGRNFLRGLGSPAGSAATGVAGGLVGGLLMDGRMDKCAPKPFVRFTDCGVPIITRKMKKQAIEAVNCSGAEAAARALTGGNLELLTMITSKQFPARRMGISGAQMATTERTQRKLMRFHKRMLEACKAPPARRR